MKNIVLTTAAFVALFSFTNATYATNGDGDKLIEKFNKIDTNGDGFIDKKEAEPINEGKLLRKFDRIDSNSDGKITLEEAKAFKAAKREAKAKKEAELNKK